MKRIVLSLLCLLMLCSCGMLSSKLLMPGRDEAYSYLGPGNAQVDRKKFSPILFSEDATGLCADEKKKLVGVSKFLRDTPSARLLIVGFAPEKGTEEYNRVLGEQRAQAVRQALLELGCKDTGLQTLSYGEDGARSERCVELGIVH